jgi:phosphoribosylanthranilate isomerase
VEPVLRRFESTDSIVELTDLLHRAYAPLAAMGLRFVATWQDATITARRISRGECWVLDLDGRLVGAITWLPPESTKGSPWYDRPDVASFQQLAVDPDHQKRGWARRLVGHAEDITWRRGYRHLALDTSEEAHHLLDLYRRCGYAIVEPVQWDAVNYASVVMSKPIRPRIKICCIADPDEARLALAAGAGALGLVSAMPSGPGPIPESTIAAVVASLPPHVDTFCLTSLTDAEAIAAQHARVGTRTIQLVDALPAGHHERLRERLPEVRLVQVIHVEGPESVDEALRLAPFVDALLLDSGRPGLPVPELGGTGRVHDWRHSAAIVAGSPVPVWLAGGLKPDNVREAIRAVDPHGLDLCSGVRTDGRLDPGKLAAFVAAVRAPETGPPPS